MAKRRERFLAGSPARRILINLIGRPWRVAEK
jgi:hypothetical protein